MAGVPTENLLSTVLEALSEPTVSYIGLGYDTNVSLNTGKRGREGGRRKLVSGGGREGGRRKAFKWGREGGREGGGRCLIAGKRGRRESFDHWYVYEREGERARERARARARGRGRGRGRKEGRKEEEFGEEDHMFCSQHIKLMARESEVTGKGDLLTKEGMKCSGVVGSRRGIYLSIQ